MVSPPTSARLRLTIGLMASTDLERLRFLLAALRDPAPPKRTERQALATFRRLWPAPGAAISWPAGLRLGRGPGRPAGGRRSDQAVSDSSILKIREQDADENEGSTHYRTHVRRDPLDIRGVGRFSAGRDCRFLR